MLDDDTSWHVRHLIQQEFQKLAKEMHDTLRASGVNPNNEAYAAFKSVALCLEIRVSRMVGRLQREADEAKNAEDDRRESCLAELPVHPSLRK